MMSQNVLQPSFSQLQFAKVLSFSLESESQLVTSTFHKAQEEAAWGFLLQKLGSSPLSTKSGQQKLLSHLTISLQAQKS